MDYTPDNTTNLTVNQMVNAPQDNQNSTITQSPSPAEIYHTNSSPGTPQYHYGAPQSFFNPQYLEEQRKKMFVRKQHEKNIKLLGTNTGATLLLVLIFSFAMSFLLVVPQFSKLYGNNLTFSGAFGIFYSVVSVGVAFLIGSFFFKKSKTLNKIPFNMPKSNTQPLLLILIGFGGCLIANYITAILRAFGEGIGIYSNYTALEDPSGTLDVVMLFIGSAVIPPLIEEFAIRGVLMQSLRKYGDAFAIITSAFVFGLFHGNAVQMPFAFLCGLFIGYAVIATESLWTGIIIHGLMNAMSVVSSALIYYFDEYVSNTFFYVGSAVGIVLGVIALIIYLNKNKFGAPLKKNGVYNELSIGEKFIKFNTSPLMFFTIILYVVEAISQLTTTPPTY